MGTLLVVARTTGSESVSKHFSNHGSGSAPSEWRVCGSVDHRLDGSAEAAPTEEAVAAAAAAAEDQKSCQG